MRTVTGNIKPQLIHSLHLVRKERKKAGVQAVFYHQPQNQQPPKHHAATSRMRN